MVTSEKRVNIGPAARAFKARGYSFGIPVPKPDGYEGKGHIKPELYALSAVLIQGNGN